MTWLNTAPETVKVLLPVQGTAGFDYRIAGEEPVMPGAYVRVPLGKKQLTGVVWGAGGSIPAAQCKALLQVHSEFPPMPEAMRGFLDWAAWYNCAAPGAMLKLAMPLQDVFKVPVRARKEPPAPPPQPPHALALNEGQATAAAHLAARLGQGFAVDVLEGLTGSGKTEVYFDTIGRALEQGGQVLVLLPEIALGVQWVERCRRRFGVAPDVWHSGIGAAARKRTWKRAVRGEARLIVGARSALFLPLPNLSLIVVDEEHEPSYKQEDGVIYHARDMAVTRAKHAGAPAMLVSATPSLETLANCQSGRYGHVQLAARYGRASLPTARLIDMRTSGLPATRFISPLLEGALRANLEKQEQSLLFLNRRGYAPLLLCRTCGYRLACPNCTAWLVLHKGGNYIQCHHCGHTERAPDSCPSCAKEGTLAACGPGVERIAEEAADLFPSARLLTLASDTATSRAAIEAGIARILNHEVDLVIGTQLLAKGHHFPQLTLIGVVDADLGLHGGDLRATERTWHLLHQLSGRAGREDKPGHVLIQTWQPEHPVMRALSAGDGAGLMAAEMRARQEAGMPPFGKLAALIMESANEAGLRRFCDTLARAAPRVDGVRVLGPAPAPLYRLRDHYRMRFLIHAPKRTQLQPFVATWLGNVRIPSPVHVKVDIDPQSFL